MLTLRGLRGRHAASPPQAPGITHGSPSTTPAGRHADGASPGPRGTRSSSSPCRSEGRRFEAPPAHSTGRTRARWALSGPGPGPPRLAPAPSRAPRSTGVLLEALARTSPPPRPTGQDPGASAPPRWGRGGRVVRQQRAPARGTRRRRSCPVRTTRHNVPSQLIPLDARLHQSDRGWAVAYDVHRFVDPIVERAWITWSVYLRSCPAHAPSPTRPPSGNAEIDLSAPCRRAEKQVLDLSIGQDRIETSLVARAGASVLKVESPGIDGARAPVRPPSST